MTSDPEDAMGKDEQTYAPEVWVREVEVVCPFCDEPFRPITGDAWTIECFRFGPVQYRIHEPCDRMYEIHSPFGEPLAEGCGEGFE